MSRAESPSRKQEHQGYGGQEYALSLSPLSIRASRKYSSLKENKATFVDAMYYI
jgi:hypothetical protein